MFFSVLFKTQFFWDFSAHLGAAYFIKTRSKIHQKSLTQACQILPKIAIFEEKSHAWVSVFWWIFDLFFMKVSAPKSALKSQKKCVLKSVLKKYFLVLIEGQKLSWKTRSKIHQKRLTQTCDFSSKMAIFGKIWHGWVRGFWWIFALVFHESFCP